MRVSDIFEQRKQPFSVETFPPKGDYPMEKFRKVCGALKELKPEFMSVTYSAGGSGNSGRTAVLAQMAKEEYGLNSVAHLTCINSTDEEIRAVVEDMKARGIENVLALRGDLIKGKDPVINHYPSAVNLIPLLKDAGFCVGAATYPEGHVACESLDADIRYLKEKEDAGADFFTTQLCFENDAIFRFLSKCRRAGVTKPITIGIMPMLSKEQVEKMIFTCGASLPAEMVRIMARYEDKPEDLRKAGIEYAADQLLDLCRHGVDGIHVYMMNQPDIGNTLFDILRSAGYGD